MNRQRITALDPEHGYVSHDRGRTVMWEPDSVPVDDRLRQLLALPRLNPRGLVVSGMWADAEDGGEE